MKVRCINDEYWKQNILTKGKVYEVLNQDSVHYKILDDLGWIKCFEKDRFEVVKEDNIEKTFQEVIATIKEREVWVCEKINRKIIKGDDGIIEIRGLNDEIFDNVVALLFSDEKYKLQRKEYTFEEAFKAYEEGKEIEGYTYRYKKIKNQDAYFNKLLEDWVISHDLVSIIDLGEIRGKWYIND